MSFDSVFPTYLGEVGTMVAAPLEHVWATDADFSQPFFEHVFTFT